MTLSKQPAIAHRRTPRRRQLARSAHRIFASGEMAELTRAFDWSATPVGPIEEWPETLAVVVNTVLATRHPMFLWWGSDLIQFYNDGYRPSIRSDKHPKALGQRGRECWPEIWHIIGPQIDAVMSQGVSTWHEDQLVPIYRDGKLEDVYWTYSYSPVRDSEGKIHGTLVTCSETTNRVIAEQRLRASEERLRMALTAANGVGIWDWDGTNDRLYADAAFASFYGVDPSRAVVGAPIAEFIRNLHPDDLDRVYHSLHDAVAKNEEFISEYRVLQPDKSTRWIAARGRALPSLNGAPVRLPGVAIDITDRKRTEERLRESEEKFRDLADNMSQIAWMADASGTVRWYNRRWFEYTGISLEAMQQGWGRLRVHHPDHMQRVIDKFRVSVASGEVWEDTFPLRRHDGEYHWFLSRAVPIRDKSGNVLRWFGTNTDIHEQKLAEAALVKTEKFAAVGRLAATLAHEINNPLQAVANLVWLLRADSTLPVETAALLKTVDEELARVVYITKQSLAFYRSGSDQPQVPLGEIIDGVLAVLGPRIRNKSIEVHKRLASSALEAKVNGEFRHALANFVTNSLDAVSPGGNIWIRVHRVRRGNERGIRLLIADDGTGIPKTDRSKLFEPFFTTKSDVGTGLGLWITRDIVQRHNGAIRMRSSIDSQNSWTVFSVFLPDSSSVVEPEIQRTAKSA